MTRTVLLLGAVLFLTTGSRVFGAGPSPTPESLRRMASDYYRWRDRNNPVASSSQGLHTWDDRLTDYSARAVGERRKHVADLVGQVRASSSTAS